jgi:CheY-like chemotaxis protein
LSTVDFLIEGIPFQNALIIDNKHEDIKSLEDYLKGKNVSVLYAKTSTEAEKIIELRPEINLVILDWLLDEESDREARQLLVFLRDHAFAPIIIYTDKGKEAPSYCLIESHLNRIAMTLDKSEVKGEIVIGEIKKWLDANPELKIFLMWDNEIKKRLNQTLWTIHDLEIGGLRALVEFLKTPEGSPIITRERDLVDFFGGVLTRNLLVNKEFLEEISSIIDSMVELRQQVDLDLAKLKAFHSFERYKAPGLEQVCTGSILKDNSGKYFVVVTPICDFSHDNKIERILLVEGEPLGEYKKNRELSSNKLEPCIKNTKSIVHYLPHVPTLPDGLMCRFDQITNMKVEKINEMIENQQMSCFTIINSPFIENLIQRMNAYLMRLGVRDLHKGEITKLLDEATADNQDQET